MPFVPGPEGIVFASAYVPGATYTAEEITEFTLEELAALRMEQERTTAATIEVRDEIRAWRGGAGKGVPKAAKLVNEYMGNEDLDDNGLVYGKDFHISDSCPDKPPMLNSLKVETARAMTWTEYLATLDD